MIILKTVSYIEDSLALMADTDWSRYDDVQDSSTGDLKAAAIHLWESGETVPDADKMISLLKRRYGYAQDDNELAAGEEQRFMDRADDLKLPSSLMDQLSTAVSRSVVERFRSRGFAVVHLAQDATLRDHGVNVETSEEGYYIFSGETLA